MTMTRLHIKHGIACLLIATFAQAQSPDTRRPLATDKLVAAGSSNLLRELDSSLEAVVAKVFARGGSDRGNRLRPVGGSRTHQYGSHRPRARYRVGVIVAS